MTYLLDVNVLLALGHGSHAMHARVEAWVSGLHKADRLATCAIAELGFVRIAPQARLSPDVAAAKALLAQILSAAKPKFVTLEDGLGVDRLPDWVKTPDQTTDGHLLALAAAHSARLATFDARIPGALTVG